MGEDIHIKITKGSGEGISQAIKRAIKDKFGNNQDVWSVAENKFENQKSQTWTTIFDFFQKETDDNISTFNTSNIKDEWTELNMNVRTYGDEELVIKSGTWDAILKFLGLKKEDEQEEADAVQDAVEDADEKEVTDREEVKDVAERKEEAKTNPEEAPKEKTVDPNPPIDNPEPPQATKPLKDKKFKQDKKHPQTLLPPTINVPSEMTQNEILELNTPDKSNAGKTVNRDNGKLIQYDEQGYISEEMTNGVVTRQITRNASGNIEQILDTKQDENGNVISISRGADGAVTLEQYFEYDKNNNVTLSMTLDSNHTVVNYHEHEYDSKGRVTKKINRNSDGSVQDYTEFKYDSKGNILKEIKYNADGNVIQFVENKYKKGLKMSTITRDTDGKYSGSFEYEYFANTAIKSEIKRTPDGNVEYFAHYEYDRTNHCTKKICWDADGKVLHYFEYTTDTSGQRIYIQRDPSGNEIGRGKATD